MSKELTTKAIELLLRGATLVSDPCPYCKGVRIIKDGSALCVNCGREDTREVSTEKIKTNGNDSILENLEEKLQDLFKELQAEKDYQKQQIILKSINDIVMIKEKIKKI